MNGRAALSPSELARRVEAAKSGAVHQNPLTLGHVEFAPQVISAPVTALQHAEEKPVGGGDHLFGLASPPVDQWLPDEGGLRRWRPVIDRIDVVALPNGERLLVVGNGLRIKLPEAAAKHLGRLLSE